MLLYLIKEKTEILNKLKEGISGKQWSKENNIPLRNILILKNREEAITVLYKEVKNIQRPLTLSLNAC